MLRLSSLVLAVAALAAFALNPARAAADEDAIAAAIRSADINTLRGYASATQPESRRNLAEGAIAALLNDNVRAEAALGAAIAATDLDNESRARAASTLAGVLLRQARFADAVGALSRERDLLGGAFSEPGEARSFALAEVLSSLPVMAAAVPETGEISLRRDRARLPRAALTVNGHASEAVLDTGASFSTIVESEARELGVRLLPGAVMIGSAAGATPARLGVAERLEFAGAQFDNVPFIVLPDEALTFAGGLYRIKLILGLPNLMRLGRLEFTFTRDRGVLSYVSAIGEAHAAPNLLLDGQQPIALVRGNGEELRLLLDTGARSTFLFRVGLGDGSALIVGADQRAARMVGAGGSSRDAQALRIQSLTLEIGDREVPLERVNVLGEARGARQGVLGQDVLLSGSGYVIDFHAMRVELRP